MKKTIIIDLSVLISSLIIISLPNVFADDLRRILLIAVLLPFWLVIVKNILMIAPNRHKIALHKFSSPILFGSIAFISILLLAYLKSVNQGALSRASALSSVFLWLTVSLFGITVFLNPHFANRKDQLKRGILYAVGAYVSFNVVLHLINPGFLQATQRFSRIYGYSDFGNSAMLAAIGIQKGRVLFPTASGVNAMGPIAGAALIVGIFMLLEKKGSYQNKLLGLFFIMTAVYALFSIDSRFSTFSALVTILIIFLMPRSSLKYLLLPAAISPAFPLILLNLSESLVELGLLTPFSRGSSDVITFNSRAFAWDSAINALSHDLSFSHLLGFGIYGQQISGVVTGYARYFRVSNPSLHNYSLQYIFDTGYLGLGLFLLLYGIVFYKLATLSLKSNQNTDLILVALLMFILIVSTLETAITIYNEEVFIMFLMIVCAALPTKIYHNQACSSVPAKHEYAEFVIPG